MSGEIYQLVAIDKNGKQQVIKFNENNKHFLSFIDSITTSKESEKELIENLITEGKLKNNDVTLVIKYNYGMVKYLPVIYNDSRLNRVASNASNKEKLKSYAYFLFDEIVPAMFNNGFYDYMVYLNDRVLSEVNNGSYLNSYTINQIRKFYETFKAGEDASYKEEYKRCLIKKINNYKTIRTLYIFFMHYINSIKNNMSQNKKYEIPSSLKYILPEEIKSEIPEELQKAYEQYGMDGVYALVDNDEIIEKGYKFK